jgi:voltage-gated potassium channel
MSAVENQPKEGERHLLRHRQFHVVATLAACAVALGAIGIYSVEQGVNPNIRTLGDAAWWAIVTATTVGYGDISPATPEGRAIAIVLMFLGIGVIGAFTATVASFFVAQEEGSDLSDMESRLARLEAKLDVLLARHDAHPASANGGVLEKTGPHA